MIRRWPSFVPLCLCVFHTVSIRSHLLMTASTRVEQIFRKQNFIDKKWQAAILGSKNLQTYASVLPRIYDPGRA